MSELTFNLLWSMFFLNRSIMHTSSKLVRSRQFPYDIQVIAENLYVPWAINISNDNKLYFTERSGAIRIIENANLLPQRLITFTDPFIQQGEGGLMGLALDPNFSHNHYIYVMHSYKEGNQIYNRVVRLVENNNSASIDRILIEQIPGAQIHNGGRLKIGPDNKLYITTGDAASPNLSQSHRSTAGKILRIELDGSITLDNPNPNSPIYSLGHRNPQGLAWNSNGVLYASEHGQSAHDEINVIYPGSNYGWPLVQGDETSTSMMFQPPMINSGLDTWAPSSITFIHQGPWQGKLLVATLRGQKLLVLSLNEDGTVVENIESLFQNKYGRLREVIQAKDGSIYLTTSNMDGRGTIHVGDDKIIRLVPK